MLEPLLKGEIYISLQGAAPNGTTVEVIYRHIQSAKAKVGQRVGGNNVVALSGNTGTSTTGAHLHIETKINGKHVDPRNFYKEFEKAEAQAGGNSAASAPVTPTANSNAALQYNSNGTVPYAAGQQAPQAPQVQQTATAPTAQSPQAPTVPTTQYQPNDFTAWNAMGQYFGNPSSLPEQFTQAVVDGANLSAEDRTAIQVNAAMQEIPTSAIQAIDQRLNGNTGVAPNVYNLFTTPWGVNANPMTQEQTTPATSQMNNDELVSMGVNAMRSLGGKTPQTLTFDNMLKLWDNLRTGKTEFPRGVQIRNIKDLENYLRSQGFIITTK